MKLKLAIAACIVAYVTMPLAAAKDRCNPKVKPTTFAAFKACTYQDPGDRQWIVDGDIAISSEKELKKFYNQLVSKKEQKPGKTTAGHVKPWSAVNVVAGHDDVWPKDKACRIAYCISKVSTGAHYSETVDLVRRATEEWSKHTAVGFTHVAAKDDFCTAETQDVDFDVQVVGDREYAARAFYPSHARARRNILIDGRAYTQLPSPVTLAGVLKHEIGHTLGFRHEATRPEAAEGCFEDNNWRPLTPYDAESVMNFPECGGTTDFPALSKRDILGAQALYGPASTCEKK